MYTRGRSQDLRDVTAKIRAIELFNPDGLLLFPAVPLLRSYCPLCESPALPGCLLCLSSPSVLRRSPFTSSPSNSPSGLLPPLRSLFFLSQRTFSVSPLSSLLSGPGSISFILRRHPRSPAPPRPLALLSQRPCSRAVPLYLPPPVVPSSLKAVESNR